MAYGQEGHIGISFQDSLGTANVGSLDYFNFISESIVENIEDLISESLSSRLDEPDAYEGMHGLEGDIVMEVHPASIGKLLQAWAGQSSMTGYSGSCYTHSFIPRSDDWDAERSALQPMTIEVYRDTGSAYQYFDCLLNQLNFEIAQGTLYKCTMSIIGAQFAWMDKTAPTYDAGSYFSWDVVSVSLGGSGIDYVSDLAIVCNNNLEGKAFLDLKKYPSRILRTGFRTVEISGTMLLVGDDEARNYKNRTEQKLVITASDPTTVADGHNTFEIDIPAMRYTAFPANIAGSGLVEVGFSGKGNYDSGSETAIEWTLINTVPAY